MNNEPNFNNQGAGQNPTPQYAPDPFEDKPVPASRGLAITSLVLGILSVLGCCCCTPLGVVAVVLAIVYSKRAGKLDGMALAGLILGIIGIVFSVIAIIIVGLNSELYMEYYEDILNQAISQGGLTLQ